MSTHEDLLDLNLMTQLAELSETLKEKGNNGVNSKNKTMPNQFILLNLT